MFSFEPSLKEDCKPFNLIQNSQQAVLCTNGDGILTRTIKQIPNHKKIVLDKYNDTYIQYLNFLCDTINQNGINIIIVFEPMLHSNYDYDLEGLKHKLHTDNVLDMTNLHLNDKLWADSMHLNHKGKKVYSKKLLHLLDSSVHHK